MKPQSLPQISQIYADKTPKQQNCNNCNNLKQPVFLCEIMQLSCIPLRHLRYLRENIHARVLNLLAQMKPNKSHADLADKPQNQTNYKLSFSAG